MVHLETIRIENIKRFMVRFLRKEIFANIIWHQQNRCLTLRVSDASLLQLAILQLRNKKLSVVQGSTSLKTTSGKSGKSTSKNLHGAHLSYDLSSYPHMKIRTHICDILCLMLGRVQKSREFEDIFHCQIITLQRWKEKACWRRGNQNWMKTSVNSAIYLLLIYNLFWQNVATSMISDEIRPGITRGAGGARGYAGYAHTNKGQNPFYFYLAICFSGLRKGLQLTFWTYWAKLFLPVLHLPIMG